MKICVTSQGQDLLAQVDPRFGRCQYFLIVDSETEQILESVQNPNVGAAGGAGIQSAQLIANKGTEAVLTGNVGPNAFNTLQAAGVKVITGVTGTVKEAIERFRKGEFQEVTGPTVQSKAGLSAGQPQSGPLPAQPQAPGFGPGMGMGYGMGWQQPMPAWQQPMPGPYQPPRMTKEQELQMLKSQLDFFQKHLDWINQKIDELSRQ